MGDLLAEALKLAGGGQKPEETPDIVAQARQLTGETKPEPEQEDLITKVTRLTEPPQENRQAYDFLERGARESGLKSYYGSYTATPHDEFAAIESGAGGMLPADAEDFYKKKREYWKGASPSYHLAEMLASGEADLTGIEDQMLKVPKDQREQFLRFVSEHRGRTERTWGEKLETALDRAGSGWVRAMRRFPYITTETDPAKGQQAGASKLVRERREAELADLNFLERAYGVLEGEDPLSPKGREGFWGKAAEIAEYATITGVQQIPMLMTHSVGRKVAGKYGGMAVLTGLIAPEAYDQFKAEGLPEDSARAAALTTAIAEALIEGEFLTPLRIPARGAKEGLLKYVRKWARENFKGLIGEGFEEAQQPWMRSTISHLWQRISHMLGYTPEQQKENRERLRISNNQKVAREYLLKKTPNRRDTK